HQQSKEGELEALRGEVELNESKIEEARAKVTLIESELTAAQEKVYDLENRIRLAEQDHRFRAQERVNREESLTQSRGELEVIAEQLSHAREELHRFEAEFAALSERAGTEEHAGDVDAL